METNYEDIKIGQVLFLNEECMILSEVVAKFEIKGDKYLVLKETEDENADIDTWEFSYVLDAFSDSKENWLLAMEEKKSIKKNDLQELYELEKQFTRKKKTFNDSYNENYTTLESIQNTVAVTLVVNSLKEKLTSIGLPNFVRDNNLFSSYRNESVDRKRRMRANFLFDIGVYE